MYVSYQIIGIFPGSVEFEGDSRTIRVECDTKAKALLVAEILKKGGLRAVGITKVTKTYDFVGVVE
jgi:hypothetical protein